MLSLLALLAIARQPPVTMLAMGDVLLARGIGTAIAKYGPDYPFEQVRPILRKADLTIFNLECPLSNQGVPQHRKFLFRADPKLAENLRRNGLQVAVLANNHTLDYGRDSLLDTIAAVRAGGLAPVGAGSDRDEAIRPLVLQRKGLRIGVLAYTDILNTGTVRRDDAPTVAVLHDETLPAEIRAAKPECDILILFFHWGVEYMKRPTERQQQIAHLCIDSGADLVLGCHPHTLQTVESYKGRQIVYSMGGFVFDSKRLGSDHGAIYRFALSAHSARLTGTIPTLMRDGKTFLDTAKVTR